MIVAEEGAELRLFTQPDHARFAAELLSLWRRDGLPGRSERRELLFATREHDNGWREADAAPAVDPVSGRPFDFLTLPAARRRELWLRGTARFLESRPYAALLILEHGLALHRDRRHDEGWGGFFATLDGRRQELRKSYEPDLERLEADYGMLALADTISLAVCRRQERRVDTGGYRAGLDRDRLVVSPFPLAGATTFRIPCRVIPNRPYVGDADLAVELARARWGRFEVGIVPD